MPPRPDSPYTAPPSSAPRPCAASRPPRPCRRPLPHVRRHHPDQPCPRAPVQRCNAPLSEPSRRRCRRLRRREFLHGERRPTASPRRSSPVELELTLLSLLAVAGPPPATVAPPRRGDAAAEPDFFSSPSTRSSGELACRPSCPAGSLTVVGARPPPLMPSPPFVALSPAAPRHAYRSGDRSGVRRSAPSRAALAEASPASAGRAHAVRVGRADAAAWATRTVCLGRARIRPSAPG
jgi:hypothetical protein